MAKHFRSSTWIISCLVSVIALSCSHPPQSQTESWDSLGPQSTQAMGEKHVLIVPVQFPDVQPSLQLSEIRRRAVAGLNAYVKEQSYGLASINADFRGWIKLPDPLDRYKVSPYNFQVDRTRVWEESENLGVLMVPSEKSGDALQAALLIQRMLHRKGPGSAGKLDKDVNNAVAAFKRFDFAGSARMAGEE